MKTSFRIGEEIIIEKHKYSVIGIDTYVLKNLSGKVKKWVSYTLKDIKGEKTWISFGVTGNYFTQWSNISKLDFEKAIKNADINTELSGIANISFSGNPGYSTPVAEILGFNVINRRYNFLGIERFLKQGKNNVEPLKSYYQTGKLIKDFNNS